MGLIKLALIAAVALASAAASSPPTQRVLDIAWHHQEHNLTCEAAALKMALSYYGIAIDEVTLLGYMSVDSRPARFDGQGRLKTWGDPATGFVGSPDGRIERYTGYGVYYEPVALAAQLAGANVTEVGSVPPEDVYQAVLGGHPVVAWISNTYHQVPLSHYVAYDGASVGYTLTEHAITVVGVRPDAVLINDPWFGRAGHAKAQFESAYSTFADMAVVLDSP